MQTLIFIIIIGVFSGIAVGLQGPLSSIINQQLGPLESVFIVHMGGVVVSLVPLLLFKGGGNLGRWRELPWYVLIAGVAGLIVLLSIGYMIPRIGVAPSMMLIIVGQMIVGVVLDHYGILGAALRPISLPQVAGIVVMMVGAWIVLKG